MKWPFPRKRDETDLRIYRDFKSGEITLRVIGAVGWPSRWEEPILTLEAKLHTPMTEATARQLRDQINTLLREQDDSRE